MKLFIMVASCSLIISSCTSPQPQSCKDFKNGTFTSFSEAVGMNLHITRKDDIQVERFEGTTDSLKLKVQWLNPCRYELTLLSTTFPNKEMVGKKIITDIIKTTANYYIFKATMSGIATFQDTMFKFRSRPQIVK